MIGPVDLPALEDEWSLSVKAKRSIYTKRFRIAVGGKSPEGPSAKRSDDDIEPVFFWSLPAKFYEEILHRFFGKKVFDITPGSGTFGEMCLKNRVGYFCLAMSEKHAAALQQMFHLAAIRFMLEEGTAIFNPKAAQAFNPGGKKPDDGKKKAQQTSPKKRKAKSKAKAGAKERKKDQKAKAAEGEESEEDAASSAWDLSE